MGKSGGRVASTPNLIIGTSRNGNYQRSSAAPSTAETRKSLIRHVVPHMAAFVHYFFLKPCWGTILPSRVVPRVLMADDSLDVREITKLLLEREGCLVIEASDGREAVDAALVSRPDLILLDIEMPVMN